MLKIEGDVYYKNAADLRKHNYDKNKENINAQIRANTIRRKLTKLLKYNMFK